MRWWWGAWNGQAQKDFTCSLLCLDAFHHELRAACVKMHVGGNSDIYPHKTPTEPQNILPMESMH